jgi:hypothetical protein
MPNVHYLGSGKFPMGFMQIIHVGDWSKRVSTGLRKEQVKWMNEYIDQGGSAWIVVRIGRDFTGLFWGVIRRQFLSGHHRKILSR